MSVSNEKMEKALTYLAETDIEYGQAKAACEGFKFRLKIAESQAILEQVGKDGTVSEKEARAKTDKGYRMMVDEYEAACTTRDTMGAKRKTAELIIEVWRSVNSSRNKGTIQ